MLTSKVCGEFATLWKFFPDELNGSGEYYISGKTIKNYCPNNDCNTDINKIHAGCLWLLNQFYGDYDKFANNANDKIDIVIYIMTWLGYKLNQKLNTEFPNINKFYNKHMKNANEYQNHIDGVTKYKNYIELINKHNYVMDISNENIYKFYEAFKTLCNMINNADKTDGGKTCLEHANKFVVEYQKLLNDNDNKDSSYNKILSTLSNDYNSFKTYNIYPTIRTSLPELITEKKMEIPSSPNGPQDVSPSETTESGSENEISGSETEILGSETETLGPEIEVSDSDSTSTSLSMLNKLILIPFIFVATLILLGITYKYSLFGFRKRAQKQHLRENLKK
ncbi:PIR protein [Plasmodium yoelii]|uniref:PIR protein n=2 Tax=Plasmodium yoelii TaxID=5861 RepID=A0AAE9WUY3_PLAYO|nr:PIR protein [Plasmodium yoelii]WBY56978.1 PIR protein [Plasmodium yoelii yoelii]CDU17772.1 YIR protein [Plasmodium yoelii]VTZ77824.1 PIR protein [Plasmodium yoelii]|eukprot:XP_022812078.1 PIR protein [Plasmodium yoelii]